MFLRIVFCLCLVFVTNCYYLLENKDSDIHEIPLIRQRSPRISALRTPNIPSIGLYLDWLKEDFDKPKPPQNRTNDTIPMQRFLDSEFYGQIFIGSPGQPMNVLFDTTWSNTWVVSKDCSTEEPGCLKHAKYDHGHSSTYKPNGSKYTANEGNYNLTGYYSIETIKFAHSKVENQMFIEMTSVPDINIFTKADGVIGLGFKLTDIDPFFYNLIQHSNITEPIFCIYLNRDPSSKKGGSIFLGGIEKKHIHVTNKKYDEITYVPVDASTGTWQFKMDTVIIDKGKNYTILCEKGCNAIVDSSTATIMSSQADIETINSQIRARPYKFGRYQVDCATKNRLPKFEFTIAGKNFTVKSKNYIQTVNFQNYTICLSSFIVGESPTEHNRWILGGVFLSEYYSIYDITDKKLGLVRAA